MLNKSDFWFWFSWVFCTLTVQYVPKVFNGVQFSRLVRPRSSSGSVLHLQVNGLFWLCNMEHHLFLLLLEKIRLKPFLKDWGIFFWVYVANIPHKFRTVTAPDCTHTIIVKLSHFTATLALYQKIIQILICPRIWQFTQDSIGLFPISYTYSFLLGIFNGWRRGFISGCSAIG